MTWRPQILAGLLPEYSLQATQAGQTTCQNIDPNQDIPVI